MKTKPPFDRHPRFIALGRDAVNSRKFPRGANATPKRFWER